MRLTLLALAILVATIPLPADAEKFLVKSDGIKYLGDIDKKGKFIECDGTSLSIDNGDKLMETTQICPREDFGLRDLHLKEPRPPEPPPVR